MPNHAPVSPGHPGLPYAHLNLRWNPFGEPSPEDRGKLWVGHGQDWVGWLKSRGLEPGKPPSGSVEGQPSRLAVQILGPPGSGKTTFLSALRDRFPGAPALAWSQTTGWLKPGAGEPLFVDDAHLLPRGLAKAVTRRKTLVLATQRDLHDRLTKSGFIVGTLRTLEVAGPGLLRRLVDCRLEWARRRSGPLPRIEDGDLEALHRRHGPNLRAAMGDLYEMIQTKGTTDE